MASSRSAGDQRVVVVTGGGGGIGAAIATELGRRGSFVVTMDPLVSLDGAEQLANDEETTAGRIVAAGGSARASSVSVTDGESVRTLFEELVDEHGRLDGVVNVAGISRPTGFGSGSEEDWRAVLEVHLDGYLNVLRAALPLMAAAGHGRVLGVTSGSGWRSADAGAYACAKRAVASLTWQLGRHAPPGVTVNAISPIAVTRMVTAALERTRRQSDQKTGTTRNGLGKGGGSGGTRASGGLSLGSMPEPDDLGPLGAHLVDGGLGWLNGQVIFAGGSEVAVVAEPRPLEVLRIDNVPSLAHLLESVGPDALAGAEASQATGGGGNPRFADAFAADTAASLAGAAIDNCLIVSDRPVVANAIAHALEARGVKRPPLVRPASGPGPGWDPTAATLSTLESDGPLDAVVVALPPPDDFWPGNPTPECPESGPEVVARAEWEHLLTSHSGIVDEIHADAGWSRAVSDYSASAGRPVRLVTLTDASTPGGRSRAQAAAQLSRAARKATDERVAAFAVGVEAPDQDVAEALGELAAHLVCHPDAPALSGAELAIGAGWLALRSHPRAVGSIALGGPQLPAWFDEALAEML